MPPTRQAPLLVAAVLGIISCTGLIGVGLTRTTITCALHITSLLCWIIPLLVALIIHAWAILSSEECSPFFALLSLGLAFLVGAYAIRTAACGLPLQAEDTLALAKSIALQKYVVIACVGWYGVFSVRMLLAIRPPAHTPQRQLDDAARKYLRRLGS